MDQNSKGIEIEFVDKPGSVLRKEWRSSI